MWVAHSYYCRGNCQDNYGWLPKLVWFMTGLQNPTKGAYHLTRDMQMEKYGLSDNIFGKPKEVQNS